MSVCVCTNQREEAGRRETEIWEGERWRERERDGLGLMLFMVADDNTLQIRNTLIFFSYNF